MNAPATKDAERVIELPAESFSRREDRGLPAVASASNATSLLQAITQAASNPQIDIEKMERLFAMHQQMVKQEAEAAFNDAMARAQAKILPVATNAANTHTGSRYAKLSAINSAITPIYTAEGLSISFDTADSPVVGSLRIIALVSHAQGHTRQHHIDLAPDDAGSAGKVNKTKVQAIGSTNSYGRRYLVLMIFNVSTHDDNDGNGEKATGLSEEEFCAYVKRIEEQTTKAKAREVYNEAVKECDKRKDVDSHKRLKAVLLKHGEFIDKANKETK